MIQSIKTNSTISDPIGKTTKAVRTKRATLGGTVRTKSLKIPFEQDHTVVGSKKRRTRMKTVAAVPDVSSTGGGASIIGALPTTTPGPGITVLTKAEVNMAVNGLQFQSPNNVGSCIGVNSNKRPASLDLNKPKKQRMMTPSPLVLESPDLQAIKTLNTPDLENILLSSNLLQTPQPGQVFPTKVGPVTSEQEAFGKGFEEALQSLYNNSKNGQDQISNTNNNNNNNNNSHNCNTSINNNAVPVTGVTNASNNPTSTTVTGMSGGSFIYTNLESNFPISIKDEPQNVPASPPVSPIDMETQEKIKLERKRQRNRVAASKCRKRKLERISKLEDKVKLLKSENIDLGLVVKNLKEHVAQLKQQVIEHIEIGCSIPTIYNGQTLLHGK